VRRLAKATVWRFAEDGILNRSNFNSTEFQTVATGIFRNSLYFLYEILHFLAEIGQQKRDEKRSEKERQRRRRYDT
jgi:hypothetical protein